MQSQLQWMRMRSWSCQKTACLRARLRNSYLFAAHYGAATARERWRREISHSSRWLLTVLVLVSLGAQEVSQSGRELQAERPMVSQAERAPRAMIASAHELASQA